MIGQIAVRLDDALAEKAREAATAAGTNLSAWIRSAIRQQAALATALRARAEEETGPRLYTDEQEDALLAARRHRAAAAFTDAAFDQQGAHPHRARRSQGHRGSGSAGVGVP